MCSAGLGGGAVCCAASCGVCGGDGCTERPGGARAWCIGEISKANRSCDEHPAPCAINPTSQASAVAEHAVIDDEGVIRVLVVAKSLGQHESRDVLVCLPAASATRAAAVGLLLAPSVTTTWEGAITYAGQTFNTSADGKPSGTRKTLTVHGQIQQGEECFAFELPPLSAALLVVPPPKVEDVELVEAVEEDQVAQVNSRNVEEVRQGNRDA